MDRVWVALGAGRRRASGSRPIRSRARPAGLRACTTSSSGRPTTRPRAGAASTSPCRSAKPQPARARGLPGADRGGGPARSDRSGASASARPGEPDRTATRLLSAAADQVGQALAQDRLAAEAQAAEIARQSDALKSALLQSVSHDLRTPLATIRAAAGTLRPGSGLSERGPAGERRRDRSRGRVPQPARDQPARPEPDRGGRAARRARRVRARRPRRPDDRPAPRAPRRSAARAWTWRHRPVDGRSRVPRRGRHQRAGERDQVRRRRTPRSASSPRPMPGEARVRLTVEDGGTGRPGRDAAAAVRQVLPRAGHVRRLAIRHRHRARRRARASSRRWAAASTRAAASSAGSRSTSTCPIAAATAPAPAASVVTATPPDRAAGPTILVVEDDEETRAALRARADARAATGRSRRPTDASALRALGEPPAGPRAARPRACPTWTGSTSSAASGGRRRRRS